MLNDYYVNQLCSPTRTSLISSRYAYNLGLAGGVITNGVSSAKMALTLPFLCCFCTFEALFRSLFGLLGGNIKFKRVHDSQFGTTASAVACDLWVNQAPAACTDNTICTHYLQLMDVV